jgi:hypothetical protein
VRDSRSEPIQGSPETRTPRRLCIHDDLAQGRRDRRKKPDRQANLERQ